MLQRCRIYHGAPRGPMLAVLSPPLQSTHKTLLSREVGVPSSSAMPTQRQLSWRAVDEG